MRAWGSGALRATIDACSEGASIRQAPKRACEVRASFVPSGIWHLGAGWHMGCGNACVRRSNIKAARPATDLRLPWRRGQLLSV